MNKNRKKYIADRIKSIGEFGLTVPFLDIATLFLKNINSKLSFRLANKKYQRINLFLEENFTDRLSTFDETFNLKEGNATPQVYYTCWLQGEKEAPELVKSCIESLKKNKGTAEVRVIDEKNFNDYVDIPEYILSKWKKGLISNTHFSDILRFALLAKGGAWVDSTVFVPNKLPNDKIFQNKIFSTKYFVDPENIGVYSTVGNQRYFCTFFFAGNGEFFLCIYDMLCEYFKKYDTMIDYFLIDYMIRALYNRNEGVRNLIDEIPVNNNNVWKLFQNLGHQYDQKVYEEICENTLGFKLSYKKTFELSDSNNNPTFFNWLLKSEAKSSDKK